MIITEHATDYPLVVLARSSHIKIIVQTRSQSRAGPPGMSGLRNPECEASLFYV